MSAPGSSYFMTDKTTVKHEREENEDDYKPFQDEPQKRLRPRACNACHTRKIACDRKQPCSSCVKRGDHRNCDIPRGHVSRRSKSTATLSQTGTRSTGSIDETEDLQARVGSLEVTVLQLSNVVTYLSRMLQPDPYPIDPYHRPPPMILAPQNPALFLDTFPASVPVPRALATVPLPAVTNIPSAASDNNISYSSHQYRAAYPPLRPAIRPEYSTIRPSSPSAHGDSASNLSVLESSSIVTCQSPSNRPESSRFFNPATSSPKPSASKRITEPSGI